MERKPTRREALTLAVRRMEWEGAPLPFQVRGTLDLNNGAATGKSVLAEAIPAAKHRLSVEVKEGEGTQQVNFYNGQKVVQSAR